MKKLILMSLALLAFYGCQQSTNPNPYWPVVFKVTGTVPADIVYTQPDGKVISLENTTLPWETKFNGIKGDYVMISAKTGEKPGEINCEIFKNAKLFKASQDSGSYLFVTAYGTL